MVEEKTGWEVLEKHPLPHPMKDLRGVSIENKIFMIGKIFQNDYLNLKKIHSERNMGKNKDIDAISHDLSNQMTPNQLLDKESGFQGGNEEEIKSVGALLQEI